MITLIVLICGLSIALTGCKDDPPKPVYEIKLFDGNWQELENTVEYSNYDEVKYDGKPKIINAIAYRNGEEFYRLSRNNINYFEDKVIMVLLDRTPEYNNIFLHGDNIEKWPSERGEYRLEYMFYDRKPHHGDPYYLKDEPFPKTFQINGYLKIV